MAVRIDAATAQIAFCGPCLACRRKGSRLRKGAPWLKTMLVQCAWAAKRAKNSYYRAQFFRLDDLDLRKERRRSEAALALVLDFGPSARGRSQ